MEDHNELVEDFQSLGHTILIYKVNELANSGYSYAVYDYALRSGDYLTEFPIYETDSLDPFLSVEEAKADAEEWLLDFLDIAGNGNAQATLTHLQEVVEGLIDKISRIQERA